MQNMLALMAVSAAITICSAAPSISQESRDHTALIKETDSGEFVVEGAERIEHERAHELFLQGAVFVDVRNTWRYDMAHVQGAVGLELNSQFSEESLAEHVAKNQTVVFYCNHSACDRSAIASAMALTWGYTDVYHFADGWSAWSGNNYEQD